MSIRLRHSRRAFTLIEMLLVIAIIAVLASIVIIAVNPSYQLAKARNARRQHDLDTVLNAFGQNAIDHGGAYQNASEVPADCTIPLAPAPARKICAAGVTVVTCDFADPSDGQGCVFIPNLQTYVAVFPSDPQELTGGTDDLQFDYAVKLTDSGRRIEVTAPNTEMEAAEGILSVAR